MKKALSVILTIVLIISVCPLGLFSITASAETATSGTTGDCTWSLDGTVLTISGNGAVDPNFSFEYKTDINKTDITKVIIESGVTSVSGQIFSGCINLESVIIYDGLTEISYGMFWDCVNLTTIIIPDSVRNIHYSAFNGCDNLKYNEYECVKYLGNENNKYSALIEIISKDITNFEIANGTKVIGNDAFVGNGKITNLIMPKSVSYISVYVGRSCDVKDIWYGGSELDKANIELTEDNVCFKNATWHYNTCESKKHTYSGECDESCNNCEWVRSINENPTHTYDNACDSECNVCGFVRTVPEHVYDGKYDTDCNICGAVREVGSPNLEIYATNLVLKNNITVNYYVDKTLFDNAGYTKPYIEFVFNGATVIKKNYEVTSDGLYYVFKFGGVMPNQINDTVKAILHTKVGDNELSSVSSEYSVATYCYNMLNQYSNNVALRTLLVDLLNYGTTAQIYSDYNIKSLANAQLTETQKTWGTQTADALSNALNAKYIEIEDDTVRWKSVGVNLKDNVAVRFKISAESKDNLTVKVSTNSGEEWTLLNKYFEYAGNGCYYVYFEELNVCQMREKIYATVYEGDTTVSDTLRYSIESYAYAQQSSSNEKLKNLLDAMIKYGDSAYRYKQTEN